MEPTAETGLRARKKQKTRDTIIRVALELFAQRGYEQTTIAEIAEAAEVAPRTIFAYFASKEEILFCNMPEVHERLATALRDRPEGATALDALRGFIAEIVGRDPYQPLRKRIVESDEALRRGQRARMAPVEQLLVEAIAKDLDTSPEDIRPQIAAAALIAAFGALRDRPSDAAGGLPSATSDPQGRAAAMSVIDDVIAFLRGGLDALRDR